MLSSALVISIILRSQDRLSSPYHRIMFFMCFWDIVSSACTALTILPMPSDVHEIYPSTFPGRAYGNATTCEMQGFFIIIGEAFAGNANSVLNIFYVCTLRYGMSEKILNRRVLPISLAVFGLLSLPVGLVPLYLGLFNPRPYELYCTIGPYPENCNRLEGIECIRGNVKPQTEDLIFFMNQSLLISGFFFIVVSLALVVAAVFKTEKMARRLQRDDEQEEQYERQRAQDFQQEDVAGEERDQPIASSSSRSKKKGFEETRTAGRVALMYIAAFFITWIWSIFSMVLRISRRQWEVWDFLLVTRNLFQPLQGFFNSLIFIYNEMHNLRKSSLTEDITFFKAFKTVIVSPGDVPREIIVLISSIEMVKNYVDSREETESKWDGFESKITPSVNLAEALSDTGMRKSDFAKVNDHHDDPPVRQFYEDPPSSGLQLPSINSSDLISNVPSGDGFSFIGHSLLSDFSSTRDKSSGQEEEQGKSRSSENMSDA